MVHDSEFAWLPLRFHVVDDELPLNNFRRYYGKNKRAARRERDREEVKRIFSKPLSEIPLEVVFKTHKKKKWDTKARVAYITRKVML